MSEISPGRRWDRRRASRFQVTLALGMLVWSAMSSAMTPASATQPSHAKTGFDAAALADADRRSTPAVKDDSPTAWWRDFNDPVLDELIALALAGNLDIRQSLERLAQSRESLRQSQADRWPSVEISTSGVRSVREDLPDSSAFSADIDLRWNTDLAGSLRGNARASRAALQAAGFNAIDLRNAIVADTARNYVDARALVQRLAIARDTLSTQDETLRIAGWRAQAGLVSAIDVEQARSQRAQTAASLASLQRSLASSRHRLAVLTGQAPGALDALFVEAQPVPKAATALATEVPADLLRRRPDVRAAERNLLAASERIGVAKAQLWPSLSLSASLGSNSDSFTSLGELISGNWIVSIAQTLFDAGKRRSVVRSREAAARESLAAYRASVLAALEEVQNAMAFRQSASTRVEEFDIQARASIEVAQWRRERYRSGLNDVTTLLDAERSSLNARDGLVNAQADAALSHIQWQLALGAVWNPDNDLDALLDRTP